MEGNLSNFTKQVKKVSGDVLKTYNSEIKSAIGLEKSFKTKEEIVRGNKAKSEFER